MSNMQDKRKAVSNCCGCDNWRYAKGVHLTGRCALEDGIVVYNGGVWVCEDFEQYVPHYDISTSLECERAEYRCIEDLFVECCKTEAIN